MGVGQLSITPEYLLMQQSPTTSVYMHKSYSRSIKQRLPILTKYKVRVVWMLQYFDVIIFIRYVLYTFDYID